MGLIEFLVVGIVAGWLAGLVMKSGGYGLIVDLILGIAGSFIGRWIFGMIGIAASYGLIGSIVVAFVGALVLVWISRLIKKA
jgi:uncharacterized membrane protein YeaQ/YmgE (transglycosylase-associated protein family)